MASEANEVFEELPIFPLSAVLFPGALLPLHIFEERYKDMMRYAVEHGGLFGLSYRDDAEIGRETPPDPGSVGCAAKINAVIPLQEGRMNILSTGLIRYRIKEIKQRSPFLIARVQPFGDDPEMEGETTRLFDDTRQISERFLEVIQELDESDIPSRITLPEEPEAFSLFVASVLPVDNGSKQHLLEMTSTKLRITRLRHFLVNAMAEYNERLRIHGLAKGNGHGKLEN